MKAMIFDCDGVVADTSAAHYRSWQRLADEKGLPFDLAANRRLLGRTRRDSLALFLDGRLLDAETQEAWLAKKQSYFLDELAAMGPEDALPGVAQLLGEAHQARIPLALASSSNNARAVVEQLGLTGVFNVIADGASVARPKPAPDIFLHVADRLGVMPEDCVVFEDSPAGVEAAFASGFRLIGIGREIATPLRLDDFTNLTVARVREMLGG